MRKLVKAFTWLIDGQGKSKAVLIDLEQWGEAWEDIYDVLVSRSRKDEPTVTWEELKAELPGQKAAVRLKNYYEIWRGL
jgi:hypothetical protein